MAHGGAILDVGGGSHNGVIDNPTACADTGIASICSLASNEGTSIFREELPILD